MDFSLLREPTAIKLLQEKAGILRENILLSTDGAILLDPPDSVFGNNYLIQKGLDTKKPILGLNLRRWFHQKGSWMPSKISRHSKPHELDEPMYNLIQNVSRAISTFAKKGFNQLVLIPMYRSEPEFWEDDLFLLKIVAKEVASVMKVAAVEEDLSVRQLISVFSTMTMMVGVRLHSTILSHIAGVPAIHIYYEHKGPDHYQSIGMQKYLIDIQEICKPERSEALLKKMINLYTKLDVNKTHLTARISEMRKKADAQLHQVINSVLQ